MVPTSGYVAVHYHSNLSVSSMIVSNEEGKQFHLMGELEQLDTALITTVFFAIKVIVIL